MKKAIAFVTVLMLAASMAACGSDGAGSASSGSSKEESKTESKSESSGSTGTSSSGSSEEKQTGDGTVYNIGICQLVQHEAIDAATQGFKDALVEKLGKDNVKFDEQNASGDSSDLRDDHEPVRILGCGSDSGQRDSVSSGSTSGDERDPDPGDLHH